MVQGRFERRELKYFIRPAEISRVREIIRPFARPDDYAALCEGYEYTVRSIYFDTPDLRFYYEKDAGVRKRKKLRLRTYNECGGDSMGSIEIKRKYGDIIFKERLLLPLDVARALLRERPVNISSLGLSTACQQTLHRFLTLMQVLRLRNVVLIAYEREAYVGRDYPRARLTIDKHVRSMIRPGLEDIHAERGLRHLTDERQILEVKFDGTMPAWLRMVTSYIGRSNMAISKYCRGIDLWGVRAC